MRIIREEEQIIRDKEIQARKIKAIEDDKRANPVKYALLDLEASKDEIVAALVESTRQIYTRDGTLKGVADAKDGSASRLVDNVEAQQLIARWLEEYDPSLKATVKIGPDCSGNWNSTAEIVVTFITRD